MIKEITDITRQANLTIEGHHDMLSEAINLELCELMFQYDSLMAVTQADEALTIEERNGRMNAFKTCLDAIIGVEDALQMHSNPHHNGL
jgi:hypothetical protein